MDHMQVAQQCRLGSTGLVMAKIPSYSAAWRVLYGCLLLVAGTGKAFVSHVPGRHATQSLVWRARVASTPPFPSTLRNETLPGVPSLSPEPLQGLKKAPGARNWPLLGNSLGMQRAGDMNRYLNKLVRRYGPLSSCHLMGYKMYNVASPELAKEVFQARIKDMEARFIFPTVRDVVGDQGMIFANGHEAAVRDTIGREGDEDSKGKIVRDWERRENRGGTAGLKRGEETMGRKAETRGGEGIGGRRRGVAHIKACCFLVSCVGLWCVVVCGS